MLAGTVNETVSGFCEFGPGVKDAGVIVGVTPGTVVETVAENAPAVGLPPVSTATNASDALAPAATFAVGGVIARSPVASELGGPLIVARSG